jgi:hypothetical protein
LEITPEDELSAKMIQVELDSLHTRPEDEFSLEVAKIHLARHFCNTVVAFQCHGLDLLHGDLKVALFLIIDRRLLKHGA